MPKPPLLLLVALPPIKTAMEKPVLPLILLPKNREHFHLFV